MMATDRSGGAPSDGEEAPLSSTGSGSDDAISSLAAAEASTSATDAPASEPVSNTSSAADPEPQHSDNKILSQLEWLRAEMYRQYSQLTSGQRQLLLLAALSIPLLFPKTIGALASLLLRIVGTAVGVGLGLGLAAHVHDALDRMAGEASRDTGTGENASLRRSGGGGMGMSAAAEAALSSANAVAGTAPGSRLRHRHADHYRPDDDSYHALMALAGYEVPPGLLRGQILRASGGGNASSAPVAAGSAAAPTSSQGIQITAATILQNKVPSGPNQGLVPNPLYPHSVGDAFAAFDTSPSPRGPSTVKAMYPTLPSNVCNELGSFIDLIMRDFINCWYSTLEPSVLYEDERERRERLGIEKQARAKIEEEEQKKEAERLKEIDRKRRAMEVLEEGRKAIEGQKPSTRSVSFDASEAAVALSSPSSRSSINPEARASPTEVVAGQTSTQQRSTMVLSTAPLRPSPFPEALYATMAQLFGSVAVNSRDNVNIMELILVKIINVISLNIKTYRELRRIAVEKRRRRLACARTRVRKSRPVDASGRFDVDMSLTQSSSDARNSKNGLDPSSLSNSESANSQASLPGSASQHHHPLPSESDITEIAMIREYLLAGKFHRAITFGVDVPSLLFADPHGRDCPPNCDEDESEDTPPAEGGDVARSSSDVLLEDDQVLEARLLSSKSQILPESELDYCRCLSHYLIKGTTSKIDFASPALRTMAIEMVASCVLAPSMNCFSPEMINFGIKKLLGRAAADGAQTDVEGDVEVARTDSAVELALTDEESILMRGWDHDRSESIGADDDPKVQRSPISGEGLERAESTDSFFVEKDDITGVDEAVGDELSISSDFRLEGGDSEAADNDGAQNILPLLTMAIIDLQVHLDFDDYQRARENNEDVEVSWDSASCKAAVQQLVLVVEAALLHGLRESRKDFSVSAIDSADINEAEATSGEGIGRAESNEDPSELLADDDDQPEDAAHLKPATLSILLMEMTSDLDSFERRIEEAPEEITTTDGEIEENAPGMGIGHRPSLSQTEISTIRTLIAAWLHTGALFRTLSVFHKSKTTILRPFYQPDAFFRGENATGFLRQLNVLDGVDIFVDTTAVLRGQSLDLDDAHLVDKYSGVGQEIDNVDVELDEAIVQQDALSSSQLDPTHSLQAASSGLQSLGGSIVGGVRANIRSNRQRLSRLVGVQEAEDIASELKKPSVTPLELAVAAAANVFAKQQQHGITPPHLAFSRNDGFASSLRLERERRILSWAKVTEAASRSNKDGSSSMICHTSGLTENDVLIHRELHQLARAFYSGTVVFNALKQASTNVSGGNETVNSAEHTIQQAPTRREIVSIENVANRRRFEVPDDDSSFLLRAQSRPLNPIGVHRDQRDHEQSFKCFVASYEEKVLHPKTKRYCGGRYIRRCLLRYYPSDRTASVAPIKDVPNGSNESRGEFPFAIQKQRHLCNRYTPPGTGNALAESLLASKVMESSDFAQAPRTGKAIDFVYRISLFEKPQIELGGFSFFVEDASAMGAHRADASALEMSDAAISYSLLSHGASFEDDAENGPLIRMKLKDGKTKPVRPSFLRAALLLTSTRQEAQISCLLSCVKSGSARSATKALTDTLLQPCQSLLEFAVSRKREKQSILLRDKQFGMNHIDCDQLRRNGIIYPRYPTVLKSLSASIVGAVKAKNPGDLLGSPAVVLYKIKCVAIVERMHFRDGEDRNDEGFFKEEWSVLRPFRDFTKLHQFLKSQVSANESSGGTGAKIVRASAAALAFGESTQRLRKALIPSLGQATKAGALGVTQKSVERRRGILNTYLAYLIDSRHLLHQCPEILRFLGACDALPANIGPRTQDLLGRFEMKRSAIGKDLVFDSGQMDSTKSSPRNGSSTSQKDQSEISKNDEAGGSDRRMATNITGDLPVTDVEREKARSSATSTSTSSAKKERGVSSLRRARWASIKAQVESVKLSQVRNGIFRLIRYQFDLDNASFFRSRIVSALKTMSFAVTSAQEFHKMLFQMHLQYASSEAWAGWVLFVREILWPDGVFFQPAEQLSEEELQVQKEEAKEALINAFPEQMLTLLGQEIMYDGIAVFHEMLQNRVVLKSMAYMLMDEVWVVHYFLSFETLSRVLKC